MTPPCGRCHGAPYTPRLAEGWERPGAALPDCPAEDRWSGEGGYLPPEGTAAEGWIRSNFENAREARRPLRIDLAEARLSADIRLRSAQRRFAAWPWAGSPYQAVEVETSGARLGAEWEVRNNALVLGLRELLSIEGLAIDGPLGFNGSPESLQVGDYGGLHLISRVTPSLLFFLEPFMVPRPPFGRDFPTPEQWEACEAGQAAGSLESCTAPLTYPNHRADPRLDRVLTQFLPAEFLENGRLPVRYNLEDFIADLGAFLARRSSTPGTPSQEPWALLEDWLAPGSHVDLDIARLNDVFVPGILDLGPSRGQVRLSYLGGRRFGGVLENFEIQLDPSGYPAARGGERSLFEVQSASIHSASGVASLDGIEVPSGLNFEFDAERGELWGEGNIRLQSDLTVPLWGNIELDGELAFRSAWRVQDGAWRPVPGTTHLEWRNLEIWETGSGRPLLTQARISLSDVHDPFDPFSVDPEGFRLQIQGRWGREGEVDLDASLPVPLDSYDDYDFERFLQELPASLALQFFGAHSYEAQVRLHGETEGNRYRLRGELDLARGTGARRQGMIENGEILLDLSRPLRELGPGGFAFRASRIAAFGLDLQAVRADLNVEELSYQEGVLQAVIPELHARANPRGSRRGLLRGALEVALRPTSSGALTVVWDGPARRLTMDNLDLRFSVQGLHLSPLQSLTARQILDSRIAALGADGRLRGDLQAELPLDRRAWRARGSLRFQGDRNGDLYFLDSAGHRVGPAVVRDTRWRFSRIDRIDWNRRYALGRFHLDTLLNFSSLLPPFETESVTPAFGSRGQELLPYEINGIMPYDNQPWSLTGFQNRIVDYLLTLCRREPSCREVLP